MQLRVVRNFGGHARSETQDPRPKLDPLLAHLQQLAPLPSLLIVIPSSPASDCSRSPFFAYHGAHRQSARGPEPVHWWVRNVDGRPSFRIYPMAQVWGHQTTV